MLIKMNDIVKGRDVIWTHINLISKLLLPPMMAPLGLWHFQMVTSVCHKESVWLWKAALYSLWAPGVRGSREEAVEAEGRGTWTSK